ncbi:MAG: retropepsin-like aspartic protease [Planctomycetota bacterium]|nr:retropepsin-like aspartic protease [Planctomycetota bacterium]
MSRQCLHCDSYNDPDALHCDQCGSSLISGAAPAGKSSRGQFPWLVLTMLLVTLVVLRWEFPHNRSASEQSDVDLRRTESGDLAAEDVPFVTDPVDLGSVQPGGTGERIEQSTPVLWGWVDVQDPAGLVLAKIPGVVTSDGWLALPRVSLLGAEQVRFRRGLAGEAQVVEGAFRRGDDLSLWRLQTAPEMDLAPLAPWDPNRPVWRVVPTGRRQEWFPDGPMIRVGSFLQGTFDSTSPAILVQDDAIVGWIPGEHLPGAWFWAGPDEEQLLGASLREFQLAEFEGGQIAAARILLDPELDDLNALQGLARAPGRPRLLAESEIPTPYRKGKLAVATLERLSSGLSSVIPGSYFDVLSLDDFLWLEAPQLCSLWLSLALKAQDVSRLSRAVQVGDVILDQYGDSDVWREAIELLPALWSVGAEVNRSRGNITLAIQWIVEGRNRFPADDALRLLDAERLLDDGHLDASAELLALPVLRSDLKVLRQELLERLELERRIAGRILIRFAPGSTVIRTTALVGGVPIDFVVDTGASATSIPPSALVPLGIEIDENTPRRRVRTASDEFEAPTVPLPRVDLGGAIVDGMMATVLDLPGQFNTGLLGMDFLGKFRIDLDVERGWLLLEPR